MSGNTFIQMAPLAGNSGEGDRADWTIVNFFNILVSNEGQQSPDATFGFLEVNIVVDATLPDLFIKLCDGTRIDEIVLDDCRLAGGANVVVYKLTLTSCRIVSVMTHADSSPGEEEKIISVTVKFGYNTMNIAVTPIDGTGAAGSEVTKGWNTIEKAPL